MIPVAFDYVCVGSRAEAIGRLSEIGDGRVRAARRPECLDRAYRRHLIDVLIRRALAGMLRP